MDRSANLCQNASFLNCSLSCSLVYFLKSDKSYLFFFIFDLFRLSSYLFLINFELEDKEDTSRVYFDCCWISSYTLFLNFFFQSKRPTKKDKRLINTRTCQELGYKTSRNIRWIRGLTKRKSPKGRKHLLVAIKNEKRQSRGLYFRRNGPQVFLDPDSNKIRANFASKWRKMLGLSWKFCGARDLSELDLRSCTYFPLSVFGFLTGV